MIRIEDTDQARSSEESARGILEDLAWLGITWDDGPRLGEVGKDARPVGPYFQAQRIGIYNQYLEALVKAGRAYPAFESNEELDAARKVAAAKKATFKYPRPADVVLGEFNAARWERAQKGEPHVVRFAMPPQGIAVKDEVLGEVKFAAGEVDDFVIRKQDGFPTYHFAVVVDDELMGVTHVMRAQEHLINTPKHVAMQAAMVRLDNGAPFRTPVYAHMPLICNPDGSKMSKRDRDKTARRVVAPLFSSRPATDTTDDLLGLVEKWNAVSKLADATKQARAAILSELIGRVPALTLAASGANEASTLVEANWPALAAASRPVYSSHVRKFLGLLSAIRSERFEAWLSDQSLQLGKSVDELADAFDVALPEIEVWDFRKNGYIPQAITNFLGLLGWSTGEKSADGKDVEKFDNAYLASHFSIDRIGKTSAKFDRVKLLSFNGDSIAAMSGGDFVRELSAWAKEWEPAFGAKLASLPAARMDALVKMAKSRCKTLRDAMKVMAFALVEDEAVEFDAAAMVKAMAGNGRGVLEDFKAFIAEGAVDVAAVDGWIKSYAESKGLKMGDVAQPIRVGVTGSNVSPPLGEVVAVLGRESAVRRVERCLAKA